MVQPPPPEPGRPADNRAVAWLVAVAMVPIAYLPAAFAYERVTAWLRPMQHAEEAMGRGIEVMFIAGPVGACLMAGLTSWLTYRSRAPHATRTALLILAAVALLALGIARWSRLL